MASRKNGTINALDLKGFLRVTLTDKQKEAAKSADVFSGFEEWGGQLLQQGYKLSLSWDAENSVFYSTLTQTGEESPWRGWALSGRGPTPEGALKMLFYKHFTVLKEDWAKASSEKPDVWG
jgi:hypothetical protein